VANDFSFWKGVVFPEEKLARQKLVQRKLAQRKRLRRQSQRRRINPTPTERRRLVKRWELSKLTQADFCKAENIYEWEFSRLKALTLRERKKAANSKQAKNPDFVEVHVEKAHGTRTAIGTNANLSRVVAEIHFSGGAISIFSEIEVADLKKIVTALTECASDRTQ
jgi:hypothetical protein